MQDFDLKMEMRETESLASQQNGFPLLRKLRVKNKSHEIARDVRVRLAFDPAFASCDEILLGDIPAGKSGKVDDIPVNVSTDYLAALTESVSGTVTFSIRCGESEDGPDIRKCIRLYPYDRWEGLDYPELLPCYCVPNNPALRPVIRRASEILGRRTGDPSLDGYQTGNPNRVKQMVGAVFDAVKELGITYSNPPASAGQAGQRIRLPEEILSSRMGTCLDTTLLQASCLEAIGVRPVLVLTTSHAFCGVWLVENCSSHMINKDAAALRKRTADGINEMIVFETTLADRKQEVSFDKAVSDAEDTLFTAGNFYCWIDVEAARRMDICPLSQRILTPDGYVIVSERHVKEHKPEEIPEDDDIDITAAARVDKRTIWERKLLDLSLRNELVNLHRGVG